MNVEARYPRRPNLLTEVMSEVLFKPHITIPRLCERYGGRNVLVMTALTLFPAVVAYGSVLMGGHPSGSIPFAALLTTAAIEGALLHIHNPPTPPAP